MFVLMVSVYVAVCSVALRCLYVFLGRAIKHDVGLR